MPPSDHLIYLHGRIVQDRQSLRPEHPEYGVYDMAGITGAFRERGFVVNASIRPKSTTVSEAADEVVAQVRQLLSSGVPPDRITIVGASMGAAIALRVSSRLGNRDVRFALLGPCISVSIPAMADEENAHPSGRILAVREESDIPSSDCATWPGKDVRFPGLHAREVVIDTGLDHGFLYRPIPEWFDPVVEWARAR